jgi:hypothetical protein
MSPPSAANTGLLPLPEPGRTSIQFEVHALRGARWLIEAVLGDGDLAQVRARQLLAQADVDGIRVWKEIHDPVAGRSSARIVVAETKPRPKRRRRVGYLQAQAPAERLPAADPPRRHGAPPPERPDDRGLALATIGCACAALVALAVMSALG